MEAGFRILPRVFLGTIVGTIALVALLCSFITFGVCLAAGAGVGALLASRSRKTARKDLVIDAGAYAAFFPALAIVLGPGHAAPLPFFLFYVLCSAVLVAGYVLGRWLKQRRAVPSSSGSLPVLGVCILLTFGLGWAGCADKRRELPETLRLFVGPSFLTNNPALPEAKAVLVNGDGTIADAFASVPADTTGVQVVRIPGQLALPGLHDAHAHLNMLGLAQWGVDLQGVTSREALREEVAVFVRAHPDRSYYLGSGWDQDRFTEKAYPTWEDLDGLTDRPIFLLRIDQHAALVNRTVLQSVGIDRDTVDPEEGRILRDETGAPTGILIDAVMYQAQAQLPKPTAAERKWMLRRALDSASRAGLVAVHDMAMDPATMGTLQEMQQEEVLPIRIFAYVRGDVLLWLIAHRLRRPWQSAAMARRDGRIEIMGIKLLIDGAVGSRGALLFEDYSDEPGHRGAPAFDLVLQRSVFRVAQSLGYQVAIHAVGDSANDIALAWIEHHHRAGNLPTRIEHAQVLRSQDMPRFADARVVTSMQPIHVIDDMHWTEARLGMQRAAGAYAWRSLLDAGALMAFGSDAPVSSIDPTLGFHAALTRQSTTAQPPGGWFPEERLTFEETLDAYTRGAVQAVGHTKELGALEVGKQFDLSVFDRDCRNDSSCWITAVPTATIVGGEMHRTSY